MNTIYGNAIIIPSMDSGTVVSVQDTKAVTITENGTTTITPDAGYDGLSSVDVTVDVAGSGGGSVETCTVEFRSNIPDDVERYAYENVILPVFENGKTTLKTFTQIKNLITIPNVICNSLAFIQLTATPANVSSSNTTTIVNWIDSNHTGKLLEFVGDAVCTVQMIIGGGGGAN